MAFQLPRFSYADFSALLLEKQDAEIPEVARRSLHAHYLELARWNQRINLVGPGTSSDPLGRHYLESLAALPLLPQREGAILDLGSGAGFPGLVLAAVRRDLALTLVEARVRKWAFLRSALRRASLPATCINVRVRLPLPCQLPERIDTVTSRALRLDKSLLAALGERLSQDGSILLWTGARTPEIPDDLRLEQRLPLAAGTGRQLLVLRPKASPTKERL